MKRAHTSIQGTIIGMWLGIALFNGAMVWAGDSGSAGTTQRFRGMARGPAPQVTAEQTRARTSMRFAAMPPASGVSKEVATLGGSTLRFALPAAGSSDESRKLDGLVDSKGDNDQGSTFN